MHAEGAEMRVLRSCPGDPFRDLALEEDLLRQAGPPTLFLYSWPRPTVVLGCGQPDRDLDLGFCQRAGIPVLRRSSGGTAIVHHDDLAVSLVLGRAHPWNRGIGDLYDRFLDVIQGTLWALGVPATRYEGPPSPSRPRSPICFEGMGRETLLVGGRKAVGCAQARRRNAVLVHGVLLLHLDPDFQGAVFGVPPERILASLAPLPPLDRQTLLGALEERFRQSLREDP